MIYVVSYDKVITARLTLAMQNPVIVVPGITATDLVDDYPLKADEIWTMVFNKEYDRVALHPDDLRYEAIEPAHVVAGQLFPIYSDLIRAMRHELSVRADQPTPVFAFPYDWRMDISVTAKKLGKFVDEVIARTKLLKHYARAEDLKVDLVGHSMGGLVITEYLSQRRRGSNVDKVVTIGTPYLGSIEAIVKITTGMSLITGPEPKEREREAARVTPSLYQLFPS
ncbi:MAG: alpha/beta hydrolase, partial [Gammaproteobacteria bacterium]|nr:alpha/beta hydrolase [Gammaproteobacteria bacterium]